MIYVFDSSSFSEMSAFFPNIFVAFWLKFDASVDAGEITSTKEVLTEIERSPHEDIIKWAKDHKVIFPPPDDKEAKIVSNIFSVPKFLESVGKKQILRGTPVADPFVVARAKVLAGCVVTEERFVNGGSRIPNICEHYNVSCINLKEFLIQKNWRF
ncbi:MAG: DUF4411 family protein [Candidatus Symbiobacter sp.]|nr:DUF4411 family protein [Candidatus Symbiobacter sp.]